MACKTTCNRCGVLVEAATGGTVTAVVPAKALASEPVDQDYHFEAIIGMPEKVDYCLPCLISGLTSALIGPMAAKLPADALTSLTGHLRAIDVVVIAPVAVPEVEAAAPTVAVDKG